LCALILTCCAPYPAQASEGFSPSERALIASFGPWPPRLQDDPSNRLSGSPAAIELGGELFFDKRLSRSGEMSCADCHQPDKFFSDGFALNPVHGNTGRHTPSLLNLRWNHWFGWGGEADSLWSQTIRPLVSPAEMNMTGASLRTLIARKPGIAQALYSVTGGSLSRLSDEQLLVEVSKLLAAYQETLITPETLFDQFRIALKNNDSASMSHYPASAKRGLKIFIGKGRCHLCHFGPLFSNGEFADIGVSHFIGPGGIDKGRYSGIQQVKKSRFNLLGPYNDSPNSKQSVRSGHVKVQHRNWGEFKIPSLRNVSHTAPYMHNGSLETLKDVIEFYSNLDEERLHVDGEKILRPLNLTNAEKSDLLSFLGSLSAP